MKSLKAGLVALALSASGCIASLEYVQEDSDENLSLDVNVVGQSRVLVYPCTRAGIRFNHDEYSIRCNFENFFVHNKSFDYLQYSGIAYYDENQDGDVDRIAFEDVSLRVNSYNINRLYQIKLWEFRKNKVDQLWADWLRLHPNQD